MVDFFKKNKSKTIITAIFLILSVILACTINVTYSKYCRVNYLGKVSFTLNSRQTIAFDLNGGTYEYGILPPSELLVDIGDYIGTTKTPWPLLPVNSSGVQATAWQCDSVNYTSSQTYRVEYGVTFKAVWE